MLNSWLQNLQVIYRSWLFIVSLHQAFHVIIVLLLGGKVPGCFPLLYPEWHILQSWAFYSFALQYLFVGILKTPLEACRVVQAFCFRFPAVVECFLHN